MSFESNSVEIQGIKLYACHPGGVKFDFDSLIWLFSQKIIKIEKVVYLKLFVCFNQQQVVTLFEELPFAL